MQTIIEVKPVGRKAKPAKGPERTVQFTPNIDDEYSPVAGVIEIVIDGKATRYVVSEFPTGWIGRGFMLFKIGSAEEAKDYNLFLCQRGAEGDSCDCADAIYRGRACKHLGAVRKLIEKGNL
jgi:hypothetical protein